MAREAEMIETYVRGKEAIRQVELNFILFQKFCFLSQKFMVDLNLMNLPKISIYFPKVISIQLFPRVVAVKSENFVQLNILFYSLLFS